MKKYIQRRNIKRKNKLERKTYYSSKSMITIFTYSYWERLILNERN